MIHKKLFGEFQFDEGFEIHPNCSGYLNYLSGNLGLQFINYINTFILNARIMSGL